MDEGNKENKWEELIKSGFWNAIFVFILTVFVLIYVLID